MTLFDGIGGLSQTRDLFTAPGSLLGYDPYFQDAQRFQQGGPVTYASLQDLDPDPYGANRTAAQRGRSIMGIDPLDVLGTLGTSAIGGLPGLALGALGAGIGAYRNVSEAEKMRAGMLPPEAYKTLGLWDTLATAWPEWLGGRSYEEAITDKDLETMSKYGMGLAAGVGGDLVGPRGGYSLYTPQGTDFGGGLVTTREPGPRFTNPQARQEYQDQLDRARQFDIEARTSGRQANLEALAGRGLVRTETLPPAHPRVTTEILSRDPPITVENLPPPDRWADYQAARHGIAEAVDRAAAQKAAEEFAAWTEQPPSVDYGGDESFGFGSMDDYGGGLGY